MARLRQGHREIAKCAPVEPIGGSGAFGDLFRDAPQAPKQWSRQLVTHVIDSVGLKIKGDVVKKRVNKIQTRLYTYKLDGPRTADMWEFLALKLQTMSSWNDGMGQLRIKPLPFIPPCATRRSCVTHTCCTAVQSQRRHPLPHQHRMQKMT